MVVDRFSKAAHFRVLASKFTASSVTELFSTMVCELCGLHKISVSDWDAIFTSNFWQALFKLNGTTLLLSSSYLTQTDG